MIGATGAKTFTEAVRMTAEVFFFCREKVVAYEREMFKNSSVHD